MFSHAIDIYGDTNFSYLSVIMCVRALIPLTRVLISDEDREKRECNRKNNKCSVEIVYNRDYHLTS